MSSTKQLQMLLAFTHLFDLDKNFTGYSQIFLFGVFYNNKLTLELQKKKIVKRREKTLTFISQNPLFSLMLIDNRTLGTNEQ